MIHYHKQMIGGQLIGIIVDGSRPALPYALSFGSDLEESGGVGGDHPVYKKGHHLLHVCQ